MGLDAHLGKAFLAPVGSLEACFRQDGEPGAGEPPNQVFRPAEYGGCHRPLLGKEPLEAEDAGEENGEELVLCKVMLNFSCQGGGNGMVPQEDASVGGCQGGAVAGDGDSFDSGCGTLCQQA